MYYIKYGLCRKFHAIWWLLNPMVYNEKTLLCSLSYSSKLPLCSSPVPPLEVYSFFCSLSSCLLLSVWLLSALSWSSLTLIPAYIVVTDEGKHLHTSWGVRPFSVTELYLILSPPWALHAHIFSYKVPLPTSLSLLCFQRNPKTFLEIHLSIYKKSCSLFFLPEFSKVHEGDNSMTSFGLFSVTRKQFSRWHGVTWSPTYPPVSPRSFLGVTRPMSPCWLYVFEVFN